MQNQEFETWLNSYPYDVLNTYKENQFTVDQTLEAELIVLMKAYQIVMKTKSIDYFKYEEECAKIWHNFRNMLNLTKTTIKVIISNRMSENKANLDKFAASINQITFFEWIDYLDSLHVSIQSPNSNSERPFFSIVIACYNDGRYQKGGYINRLLSSLCMQGVAKNDIEVIISDDCSPVPYDEIISAYEDRLTIVRTKTDYNFAPGNTRQKGVDIATGQWLCFADHDDIYYPGALRAARDFILSNNEQYYIYSPFNGVTPEGVIIYKYDRISGWCHGKFFNLDNLWKPNGIHFVKDLKSHEDIAICTQVGCVLDAMKHPRPYLTVVTYAWTDNPKSISHDRYQLTQDGKPRSFLEVFFDDYLQSTGYLYLEEYRNNKIPLEYAKLVCIQVLCYAYIYIQAFQTQRKDWLKDNLAVAGRYLSEVKTNLGIKKNEEIYQAVAYNRCELFYNIRTPAEFAGQFIPQQGFKPWLDTCERAYNKSVKC